MKKSISLLLLSLLMITPSCQKPKEVTNEYNIVPQPNQLVPKEGRFELSNKVRLVLHHLHRQKGKERFHC